MSTRAKVPLSRYQRNKANFPHQFGIYLTEGQERALQALKSEIAVDNWARKLIMDALSGEPMQTLLRPY